MKVEIDQQRLAAPDFTVEVEITNGMRAVSFSVLNTESDTLVYAALSPQDAEAIAYDLLCKAYNVRNSIHDSNDEARGMYAGKKNLTETEALAGLGYDYRED